MLEPQVASVLQRRHKRVSGALSVLSLLEFRRPPPKNKVCGWLATNLVSCWCRREDSELFRLRRRGNVLILFEYFFLAYSSYLKIDLAC